MPIKKDFDLHHQFTLYLRRCGVNDIAKMPADQLRETRRAFMGACGQMLILFRDDVTEYDDDKAVEIMQDLLDQVGRFWESEMKNQN